MTTLVLGVIDQPYDNRPPGDKKAKKVPKGKKKIVKKTNKGQSNTVTTGDVAEFLETKYKVMERFSDFNMKKITSNLEESLAGALENMMMGSPPLDDPFVSACANIEKDFKSFLSEKKLDSLGVSGIPTKASLDGDSKRFKKGKGPKGRPSFIDTGLYQASFKSWVK